MGKGGGSSARGYIPFDDATVVVFALLPISPPPNPGLLVAEDERWLIFRAARPRLRRWKQTRPASSRSSFVVVVVVVGIASRRTAIASSTEGKLSLTSTPSSTLSRDKARRTTPGIDGGNGRMG